MQSEGRAIGAVSAEELRRLLEGRWDDVTHLSYRPSAGTYVVPKETAFGHGAE